MDYHGSLMKSKLYFVLGISLILNLIVIIFDDSYDPVTMNAMLLTSVIAFFEYRDSKYISKKSKKKYDETCKIVINEFLDCKEMAIEDLVTSQTREC